MLYPTTKELLERVDSRYTLVIMVSKRARQLLEGATPLGETKAQKAVSIAVNEIATGAVTYTRGLEEENKEIENAEV